MDLAAGDGNGRVRKPRIRAMKTLRNLSQAQRYNSPAELLSAGRLWVLGLVNCGHRFTATSGTTNSNTRQQAAAMREDLLGIASRVCESSAVALATYVELSAGVANPAMAAEGPG